MADNLTITPGSGANAAANEIGGVKYQRVKISLGVAGVANDAEAGAGDVNVGTQRVTLANDDPAVVDLAAMEALLTTIDADTGGMAASLTLIDDVVHAEDAGHVSADRGVLALAVRRDAKAVGSGTDGDYSTLNVSPDGDLRVDSGKAHIVRVTPTITVPGTAYIANDCFGGEMTIANAARISGGSGVLMGITMSFEDDIAADTVEVLIWESDPAGTYTDNTPLAVSDADTYLLLGSVILNVKTDLGDGALLKATNLNIPYVCNGSANLYATAVLRTSVPTPTATDAAQFTFHLIRD